MNNSSAKLSLKEKIGYGFGDLASVLYWQTFMLYFTYFYTDVFLLPAAVAATMFLVSRVFDGVNDPLMGIIADRTETRWGKFRPYLLWLCVPFAISGVLVFTTPNFGMTGKIVWAYATFILIMMLYTAINIPYTSLLGVISPSSSERTSVSSVKFLFAFAAGIIISATLLPMAKKLGAGDMSIVSAQLQDEQLLISEGQKGNAKIILRAIDPAGNATKQEFDVKVNPAENNTPVIVNPFGDQTMLTGFGTRTVPIEGVFSGLLNSDFEYEAKTTNEAVVTAEVSEGRLILTEQGPGNADVRLIAKDRRWGDKEYIFRVNAMEHGNSSPRLIDSASTRVLESGFGSIDVDLESVIKDPDGDQLTFTVESSDNKVITPVVEGSTLSFFENRSGIAELTITATDGKGGYYSHSIRYLIAAETNNAPFVNQSIGNIVQVEGFETDTIDISNLFIDVDGDDLKYEIEVINAARGWQRSFMIVGVAAILFFLIAFRSTKERVRPPKSQQTTIGSDLADLFLNKPWVILLLTTITFILFVAVRSSVTVHYFKYFIGTQDLDLPFLGLRSYDVDIMASAYNTIGQISSLIGVLLVAWFANVVGKKKAFVTLFIIAIFSTAILYFLTAEQLGLVFFFQITGSMTGGPLSVLLWAMYADTADYGEYKNGRRATGLIFSASTMSQKFGWAIGAYVALTLMAQLGFKPNEAQSSESLNGLLLLFSLIPAGMGVISILLSFVYPLNEKRVEEITAVLNERRKENNEDSENV